MTAETPAIHEFAIAGDMAGVLDELAKGVNIDVRNPATDRTALMEAVSSPKARVDLVRLLIERGADVNAVALDRSLLKTQEQLEKAAERAGDTQCKVPAALSLKAAIEAIESLKNSAGPGEDGLVMRENVLSRAVQAGDFEKVKAVLDAGADVRYERPHKYNVLIDAMHSDPRGAELVPIIQLLIDRGAELNTVTPYGESALSVSSNSGRFDAVAVLLRAGADPAPLQWTSLMRAVALGSSDEVKAEIENGTDLAARDFWNRTAWLLSLQVGDIAKAKLLLAAGADRKDRGRCGKTPLMYPVINGHTEMLSWLLSERFDPNDVDKFGETPLMHAAEEGATESAKILIDAGAHIHRVKHSWAAIRIAINLDIVRLLVNAGADLSDISDETRAAVTKLPHDGRFRVSREEYFEQKHRRFGESNPQKMNFPFWKAMVTSGRDAYGARERFDDINTRESPVWCFRRFGKSITELPDGRVIEIAGEHEDGYDPEFCIYNDVIVHHGDGTFDIYGYPRELFPPTDFHTSTLVGKYIYIIGNLGYLGERQCGCTPVLRLDVESLEIERVETSGDNPGWISEHKATCARDGRIQIRGGKICQLQDGVEQCSPNTSEYVLDLATSAWTKIG